MNCTKICGARMLLGRLSEVSILSTNKVTFWRAAIRQSARTYLLLVQVGPTTLLRTPQDLTVPSSDLCPIMRRLRTSNTERNASVFPRMNLTQGCSKQPATSTLASQTYGEMKYQSNLVGSHLVATLMARYLENEKA